MDRHSATPETDTTAPAASWRSPAIERGDALIYARISEDRTGRSTAPERQIADARELAEKDGRKVAGVYVDRDLSASDARVTRPEFEQVLLDAWESGATIYAYAQDRLLRLPTDTERLLSLGLSLRFVVGDVGPLDDPQAQFMMRSKGIVAKYESDMISLRQKRKQRERAQAGLPHPTRFRPFGHTADWSGEHPEEAPIVRELVARIRAGETVPALCHDLNSRGITTTNGTPWRYVPMRSMLIQARLAGARELDGELVVSGAIAPLISVEELEAVRSIVTAKRWRHGAAKSSRRHLLSGYLVCEKCGTPLVAQPLARGVTYVCPPPSNAHRPGCGGVSITGRGVEAEVKRAVLQLLDEVALAGPLDAEHATGDVADATAELHAIDARAVELADDYADGVIDRAEFHRMRDRLADRRARATRAIEASAASSKRASLPVGELAVREWEAGDLAWRRRVLDALIVRVVISPTVKRGPVFDPSRVVIEWDET